MSSGDLRKLTLTAGVWRHFNQYREAVGDRQGLRGADRHHRNYPADVIVIILNQVAVEIIQSSAHILGVFLINAENYCFREPISRFHIIYFNI
jgi:hypothetical protein